MSHPPNLAFLRALSVVLMDNRIFTLINIAVMTVVVWIIPLSFIPFFIWLERKGSAIIQDRVGPDRTDILGFRLLGFIQNFADTLKLILKENLTPASPTVFISSWRPSGP